MLDNAFVAFLRSALAVRILLSILVIVDGGLILKPVLSATQTISIGAKVDLLNG